MDLKEMEGIKDLDYYTFESIMVHMQEINRRLAILAGVAILLVIIMFGGLMYFLSNYEIHTETISIDSTDGPANYVGNDNNGDIINGEGSSEENNN